MRRTFLTVSLIVMLLLVGCAPEYTAPTEPAMPEPEPPVAVITEPVSLEPEDSESISLTAEPNTRTETVNNTDIKFVEDRGIPELLEGFGIYGASVELDGVYPGWSGTVPLTLVNGQDKDRLFVVYAISPTRTKEGFEALPGEYLYWLTVEEPEAIVGMGQTHQVNITLEMPSDADYAGKHAEVRIRVDDTTQTGLVQIALESKWYIITAD